MGLRELIEIITSLRDPIEIAVVTHQDADPDAISSAIGINYLLNRLYPNSKVTIVAPGGISKLSRKVLSTIYTEDKLEFLKELPQADIYILVDVSNLVQLGEVGEKIEHEREKIIVIDHHIPTSSTLDRVKYKWIWPEAKACSLMVFSVLEALDIDIPKDLATLLLTGILYDTRRFIHANTKTFEVCAKLLRLGADYTLALRSLATTEADLSERLAILKGLQRMMLIRIGELIVALSYVSAYEGVLARTIISLGADLAIVIAEKKGSIRVSARSTPKFYRITGINLGRDLLPVIGRLIHGEGGGHTTAGGAVGKGNLGEVLNVVYSTIVELLWKKLTK